ncbi:MAG: heme-binding domain-containing protein [Acidimicrobiales bacterium]
MDRASVTRLGLRVAAIGAVVLVAMQFVPYGWHHPNPPVVQDASWPDDASASIARDSCYDCHSNETNWPIYSYIAPMSWLTRRDVEDGRDELNFSRWDEDAGEADDAIDSILEDSMPPGRYTLVHRGASLSDDEVDRLVAALETMDRDDDSRGGGSDDGDGDGDGGPGPG